MQLHSQLACAKSQSAPSLSLRTRPITICENIETGQFVVNLPSFDRDLLEKVCCGFALPVA
jgi:hypothetical protein